MFKIRASAASKIMAGFIGLTDKQELEFNRLSEKDKITPNQQITLDWLADKRDNPTLSEGAKTYCKDWLQAKLMNRNIDFSNKYTEKGHIMEDESIDFIAQYLDYGFIMKNEVRKEDDFMTGECDVDLRDEIIDVKNSWDWSTFPLLETEIPNKDYYWQGQVYMHLYGKKKYKIIYTLMDTPNHLIEKEALYWCRNNGYPELEQSVYDRFKKKMTYSDLPDNLRIKIYEFDYDSKHVEDLIARVKMCREYIEYLSKTI